MLVVDFAAVQCIETPYQPYLGRFNLFLRPNFVTVVVAPYRNNVVFTDRPSCKLVVQ